MFKNKPEILLFILLSIACVQNFAYAERQSLASIELQVESFIINFPYATTYPVSFKISKIDDRLNLKPCDDDLSIKFTRSDKTMGNTSISIRCHAPINWQIHLPISVQVFDDVLVNKTPLVKGQPINSHNIQYQKKDISTLQQGYFQRSTALEHLQAKRNLAAHTILSSSNLTQRMLVKSGQEVSIILNAKGLQIKSSGRALQSARRGQAVKVKNTRSNKVVEGIVTGEAQVTVTL